VVVTQKVSHICGRLPSVLGHIGALLFLSGSAARVWAVGDNEMVLTDFDKAVETANSCIVCGRYAEHRGMYIPDDSQAYGAPEGMTRHIIYGLCDKHIEIGQLVGDHVQATFELEYGNHRIQ